MAEPILLYVSAAGDLEAERDAVSRAVAEIPVDLPWRLVYSPRRSEPLDPAAVAAADAHLLLLGGDIRAPVGQEWHIATRAGRRPALFLKRDAPRTAAGLDFVRFVERHGRWRPFADAAELRRQALALLAELILERAGAYGLSPAELERLRAWQAEQQEPAPVEQHRGAGESSILLSRDRYEPAEGVMLPPGELRADGDRRERPAR